MTPLASRRRSTELGLGIIAVILVIGGYVLVGLAENADLPPDLIAILVGLVGLFFLAHLAVRRFAPRADATLLPLIVVLNGIGFIVIARLDRDLARVQSVWAAVGVAAFIGTLVLVRRVRVLERYRYTFLLVGIGFLLLPLLPGIGFSLNGARLWAKLGPITFQPGEAAKVLLVVFFAAYLVEKRELLSSGTLRVGRLRLPDPKHLGPLLLIWGFSLVVLVFETDLGSSLLFFAVFVGMLYVATQRFSYVAVGFGMFALGALLAYQLFNHVQERVANWQDPWPAVGEGNSQLVEALFGFGTGGFAGRGLGLGNPDRIPVVETDFIFAAIGEELGLLGTAAVLIGFLLLVGTGFRIAVQAQRPFSKLFATGLTTIIGMQTFVILGGVTRLIPLTGITLPFVSYGGSSLVANFVIVALLLRISDETAASAEEELEQQIRQRSSVGMGAS
ncbi:MAG: FtsW/RodA/SpoVE family cell cycle protein [Acidimicrobiia bacterium]|nr:FtsW/RodA/SpoVE family cell cycle protein [Acidimicrobiia bacterium]